MNKVMPIAPIDTSGKFNKNLRQYMGDGGKPCKILVSKETYNEFARVLDGIIAGDSVLVVDSLPPGVCCVTEDRDAVKNSINPIDEPRNRKERRSQKYGRKTEKRVLQPHSHKQRK